ncbi:MAG: dihydroorotase [Candidatus Omnitrophica bacterium]|nr:dihydroorotase [Candidatus Omnitrophota bacterium]
MSLLIKGGRVIDPANKIDGICDILIEGSKISAVAKDIKQKAKQVIEAKGKIVMPGLVDMHVHLREPGREDKETIKSGTEAALKGGVTTLLAMPNTSPPIDSIENIRLLKKAIKKDAKADVLIAATITKAHAGKELTDMAKLKKEGAVAVTDDGSSIDDEKKLLNALKKAKDSRLTVSCHCEDKALSAGGHVNLGFTSTSMGLRGISRESEYKRIERDIALAHKAKAPIHIAHVSCKESVDVIKIAKRKNVKVTAETAPHYFSLSEESVWGFDTNMKMNPPLRGKTDMKAIKQGLKDGTIDVIASDHAPHTENEKDIEFSRSEFGIIGLETILYVSIQELVLTGLLDWKEFIQKLSLNPAKILGVEKGSLGKGSAADMIIYDPGAEWSFGKQEILSKSGNSPFIGRSFKGKILYTIFAGKVAYRA